jgi:Tfp pilus assembly protein PilF
MKYLLILLVMLASCASQQGQTPKEKKADIYYKQGTKNLFGKNYTKALKSLLMAAKLNPKHSGIHNNLGMAYYFKKSPTKAQQHIKRALELDPTNTDARGNLASVFMETRNYREAIIQYKKILKDLTYERQFKTYYNLGLLFLKQREPSRAISYFEKSIEENKNYCPSHFQIGLIAYNKGFYKESLKNFKKASMGTCISNPAPHYYQGLSYMEAGIKHQARLKFEYITEKHGKTKYGTLAQIKISSLGSAKKSDTIEASRTRLFKRKQEFAPSF